MIERTGGYASTILDLISRPVAKQGQDANLVQRAAQHVQDAAHWLRNGSQPQGFWENVGATGIDTLALLGTDGLLGLAGEAAVGTEVGSTAVSAVKNLKAAQKVGEFLAENPRIAGLVGIGLKASKSALELGGQTLAATEDPHQAKIAAATGGVLGAGFAAAPEALRLMAKGPVGRWLQEVAPKAANIFDTKIPVLHQQLGKGGWTTEAGAVGFPEFAEAQQKGAGEAIGKMSEKATGKALENINAAPAFKVNIPQLPGEYAQGTLGAAPPGTPKPFTEGVESGTVWMEKTTPARTFTSQNPAEARLVRSELEDHINSPEFSRLPKARQDAIRSAAEELDHQLSFSQINGPREFEIAVPTSSLKTAGQAAEQLRATAASGYKTLDKLSSGEFSRLRKQASDAMGTIAKFGNPDEAVEAAAKSLDEANLGMNDLFDKYAGNADISPQYYAKMKTAWRYSKVLDNLHARLERMTNGITVEETERGAQRVMTGNTRELNNWLEARNELGTRSNRQDLEELIGQHGVDDIKKLTNLLSKADTARATTGVLKNTLATMSRQIEKGGLWGGVAGKMMGIGWVPGAATGATAAAGLTGVRALLRYAMTNPRVGDMITYAAQNKVRPEIYAPLISRMMLNTWQGLQEPEQQQGGSQQSPELQQQEEELLKRAGGNE
jgi:hypothetical protein